MRQLIVGLHERDEGRDIGRGCAVTYADDSVTFEAPLNRFDRFIEWALIALLAFMPLALGAVEAWSELMVVIGAGVAGLCLALKLLAHPHTRFVKSWLFVPVALFAAFVALQLVPLPAGVVAAISPETAATKTRLLEQPATTLTLSFYPPATRAALRMLLSAAVIMVVVANVFRTSDQIKRLLLAIATIGAACAGLALLQDATGASGIFWAIPLDSGRATAGPFVNYNNFAQFMNLSIGAAIALMLVYVDEVGLGRRSWRTIRNRIGGQDFRIVQLLLVAIVIGALSIFLSGSRGGMIALLVAFTATTLIASKRHRHREDRSVRAWVLTLLGLLIFAGVVYFAFDVAWTRLMTLHDVGHAAGERIQTNKDVIATMVPHFPLAGIGLENHRYVYPMFTTLTTSSTSGSVENEYVQLAQEAGVVGVALLVAFAALVVATLFKVMREGKSAVHAAAFGILFALLAVAIQSGGDFGLRVPANALLAATLIGVLVSLVRKIHHAHPHGHEPVPVLARIGRGVTCAVAVLLFAWAGIGAYRSASGEAYWRKAQALATHLESSGWNGADEEYASLISHTAAAAEAEPDKVEYRYWLAVYRWNMLARNRDAEGNVALSETGMAKTREIVQELRACRALAPTFGQTYCMLGQLERNILLDNDAGAAHIRTGCEVARSDVTACFIAGELDASEGKWAASVEKLGRALKLGRPREQVIDVYLGVDRPDLALAMTRDDQIGLEHLVESLKASGKHAEIAQAARARQAELIRAAAASPDSDPAALAQLAGVLANEKDYKASIELYRRALSRDYANVGWRMGLANTLAAAGEVSDAMREAKQCLRLRPEYADAKKLVGELSVMPVANRTEATP